MIKNTFYIILIIILLITINKKHNIFNKSNETFVDNIDDKNDWLNELFDSRKIITIPERMDHVYEFCNSFEIKPTIFNAILKKDLSYNNIYNLKIGEIACALSQEAVLKQFINEKTRHLLLMEDDNMQLTHSFYSELNIKLDFIKEYMKNAINSLPSNWDVIYFGRCWDDCAKHIPINEYLVQTRRTLCHHAIGFSRKGALIVLDAIKHPLNVPIDHIVANLTLYGKLNVYATIVPLFYQNRIEMTSTIGNYDHLPICL